MDIYVLIRVTIILKVKLLYLGKQWYSQIIYSWKINNLWNNSSLFTFFLCHTYKINISNYKSWRETTIQREFAVPYKTKKCLIYSYVKIHLFLKHTTEFQKIPSYKYSCLQVNIFYLRARDSLFVDKHPRDNYIPVRGGNVTQVHTSLYQMAISLLFL